MERFSFPLNVIREVTGEILLFTHKRKNLFQLPLPTTESTVKYDFILIEAFNLILCQEYSRVL